MIGNLRGVRPNLATGGTLMGSMRVSTAGLTVERFRMDTVSVNLANANSMAMNGQPAYRRRDVVVAGNENGPRIIAVVEDGRPERRVHEPGSPYADADGYVTYSNVEPVFEMVNMIGASRAYEANLAAFNTARTMVRSALSIGKSV